MSLTPPPSPPDSSRDARIGSRPGRLARWKLAEPARLYGYGLGLVPLLVAGVAAAAWTGVWLGWLLIVALQTLLSVVSVESIRSTAYCQTTVLRRLLEAHGVPVASQTAQTAQRTRAGSW